MPDIDALRLLRAARSGAPWLPLRTTARLLEAAGPVAARLQPGGTAMLTRHLARVRPDLDLDQRSRLAAAGVASYGRYWFESFRLPTLDDATLDRNFTFTGFDRIQHVRASGVGPIIVLPHLGGWEWAAAWLTRIGDVPVSAVVERLEPTEVFDWFVELRESYGVDVIPLGPDATSRVSAAIRNRHVVCLLTDRDINGSGVEVSFFGETTTLPGGPAALALRLGAPILPTSVTFEGPLRQCHVGEPFWPERRGRLRADVARVTQDIAHALEDEIRRAPSQWHLLGPNWPSDHGPDPAGAAPGVESEG